MPAGATRAVIAALALAAPCLAAGCGGGHSAGPDDSADRAAAPAPLPGSRARAVEPGVGTPDVTEVQRSPDEAPANLPRDPEERLALRPAGAAVAISPGAPSDAEVRAELKQLIGDTHNGRAQVLASGEALPPAGAPLVVREMIAAANAIARKPYIWGGGHGRLYDAGYDCSGSLSFAFIHAGLLKSPIAQGWSTMGQPGPGRWVSVYSNAGHVWMTVAGLRYDTSAISIAGSRWTNQMRSTAGFTVRHLPGL
jgi:hypothetical protein